MPDLSALSKVLEKLDSVPLNVSPERCVRIRHRNSECHLCADACAMKSITVKPGGGGLDVDPERCVGCGCCATVCPTEAIEATTPTSPELLSAALEVLEKDSEGAVVFACPYAVPDRVRSTAGFVQVPCIGRVDETVIVGLAVAGANEVDLVDGFCAHCRGKVGREIADLIAFTADQLLECFGAEPVTSFIEEIPERCLVAGTKRAAENPSGGGYSRRGFMDQIKTDAKSLALDMVEEASPIKFSDGKTAEKTLVEKMRVPVGGVMVQHEKSRNMRLLTYLDMLGAPKQDKVSLWQWGNATVDQEKCNGCRLCATFCPTGALYWIDDDEGTALGFLSTDCVACRLCETVCLHQAVKVSNKVSLEDLEGCVARRFPVKAASKTSGNRRFGR